MLYDQIKGGNHAEILILNIVSIRCFTIGIAQQFKTRLTDRKRSAKTVFYCVFSVKVDY